MQATCDAQIIAALIIGFCGIFAVLIKFILEKVCDNKDKRIMVAGKFTKVITILIILFSVNLLAYILKKSVFKPVKPDYITTVSPDSTDIKITSLNDLDSVSINETIKGRSQNLPFGYKIWLIISHGNYDNEYYPQLETDLIMMDDGNWKSKVTFGSDNTIYYRFTIIAALANLKAQKELVNYNKVAQEFEKRTGEWPPIDSLPKGLKFYDRIAVIRK